MDNLIAWLRAQLDEDEARTTAEARFVWALDKLMPKVAGLLNGAVTVAEFGTGLLNGAVTVAEFGMSAAELAARYDVQAAQIRATAGDFPVPVMPGAGPVKYHQL